MELPAWWTNLRSELPAADWVPIVEGARGGEPATTMLARDLDEDMQRVCERTIGRSTPLAEGPYLLDRRTHGQYVRAQLWYDPERPGEAWLDIGLVPSILWLPAGTTSSSVAKACHPYFHAEHPKRVELSRARRWMTGIPSTVLYDVMTGRSFPDEKLPAEEAVFALAKQLILDPALEGWWWGSAHDEDPFPAVFPPNTGGARLTSLLESATRQNPERIPSCSFRTRWSGAVVTGECHFDYFLVLEARYSPVPNSRTIGDLNRQFETAFPEDLPVDVVAALLGRHLGTAEAIEAEVLAPGMDSPSLLHALAAVLHGDARLSDVLRRAADSEHRRQREAVAQIAYRYGPRALLEEMWERESDSGLKGRLARALEEGGS